MKTVSALVLMLSSAFAEPPKKAANENVQPAHYKVEVEKLELDLIKSPQYSISGTKSKDSTYNKEWLQVEAKLKIKNPFKHEFIPELNAQFHIAYESKGKVEHMKIKIPYQNVDLSKDEIWVSAYIDPDTFSAITGKKRPSKRDLLSAAVTIDCSNMFRGDKGGKIIYKHVALKKYKKHSLKAGWWTAEGLVSSKQHIRNKRNTPFAFLWGERYAQIKPPTAEASN